MHGVLSGGYYGSTLPDHWGLLIPAEDFEVLADDPDASDQQMRGVAWVKRCQPSVGCQCRGGRLEAASRGCHPIGGYGLPTWIVKESDMDDHVVQVDTVGGLEPLREDGQRYAARHDELRLLEHLASRCLERIFVGLDPSAREGPEAERWLCATLDPDDTACATNHGESNL